MIYQWFFKHRRGIPHHPRNYQKHPGSISSAALGEIFSLCGDYECRPVSVGGGAIKCYVIFLDGVVSGGDVSEDVIRPLTSPERTLGLTSERECISAILRGAVYSNSVSEPKSLDELVQNIVNGYCAIVFDGEKRAVTFETRTEVQRGIEQPSTEKSVKGAKDAFIETLRTNTMLVRKKLRDPNLKLRQTVVGRKSQTNVAVMYCEGIADPERVEELMRRVDAIDIDGLITTGSLEEYIVDCRRSPFPQLLMTERPDRFALNLLEGRIGVLVDGLPLGFLLPATLSQLMKVPDDNAQHYLIASFLTALRYFSLLIAVMLPGLLIAIAMYHQEMLPIKLLLSMIEAKQQVPFGAAIEVLGMLLSFELLQEAGLRLPESIGQTVSIIGALIVGQSAVEAKVVGPVAVIIVALAGICGYTIPNQDLGAAVRICRFFIALAAIAGGMYGLMAGLAMIVYHLATIESFGTEYLSPLSDRGLWRALQSLMRMPLEKNKFRDPALDPQDKRSQC